MIFCLVTKKFVVIDICIILLWLCECLPLEIKLLKQFTQTKIKLCIEKNYLWGAIDSSNNFHHRSNDWKWCFWYGTMSTMGSDHQPHLKLNSIEHLNIFSKFCVIIRTFCVCKDVEIHANMYVEHYRINLRCVNFEKQVCALHTRSYTTKEGILKQGIWAIGP